MHACAIKFYMKHCEVIISFKINLCKEMADSWLSFEHVGSYLNLHDYNY